MSVEFDAILIPKKLTIRSKIGFNFSKESGMRSWCLMFGVERYGLQFAGSGPCDGENQVAD
jgi:hypothetical protein